MLYVTTQSADNPATAQRVLGENRAEDGGLYLPFRNPRFSREDLDKLFQMPFGERIAQILNLLFQTKISGWDVDFCIGRRPIRLSSLRHRIVMAECWHNPDWEYLHTVRNLLQLLKTQTDAISGWPAIAVRIALLFSVFGELKQMGIQSVDVSCVSGDLSLAVSAWYAREWGLPIGNIVICSNENNQLWELVYHGQLRTDAVSIPTILPETDEVLPVNLERLIYSCSDRKEVLRFRKTARLGQLYTVDDLIRSKLQEGLSVSVVSSDRLFDTVRGAYRTHGYVLAPSAALAYAGLLDYRAKSGASGHALVISEKSPALDPDFIRYSVGISYEDLKK